MIRFEDLSLFRGSRELFSQASLTLHPGTRTGVVGANGSGKSSLFALLLGKLHAESGEAQIPASWVIAHVAQETPADPRTALEYVMEGDFEWAELQREIDDAETRDAGDELVHLHERMDRIDGYTAQSRAARLLHGLGFSQAELEKPVAEFSGGWRMRLNLGQALMCRSDVLLLDEPTNHLDLEAVLWLEGWLQRYPGTLLLISHDRDFIDAVTTQIVHFDHQRLVLYQGNYSEFERLRAERLAQQQAAYEKQVEERQRIQKFVDRFRAKATKARQAQSRIKMLERMEDIAPAYAESQFHFEFPAPKKMPHTLIRMEDVAVGYGDRELVGNLNLSIESGDRVALLGMNGTGKSTLVKLVAGEHPPMSGTLERHGDLKIGYFSQHQSETLDLQASALDALIRLDPRLSEQEARDFLGGFGFNGDQALDPVSRFSGGEKARLVLALLVYTRPNLLLLDEPTNHLDLDMRHALTVALQGYEGAVIVVSHDRHLLRTVTDDFWMIVDGRLESLKGGLEEYAARLASRDQGDINESVPVQDLTENTQAARKDKKRREAELRQRSKPLRDAIARADATMQKVNQRLEEIEKQLAQPEIYEEASKDQLQSLLKERGELGQTLQEAEESWMQSSEELEALTTEEESV
ncbi:MAG: ATP-binding cassette domain-containing protein [Gammaproteobacteria bacterium]|nr:ATP-binding cassette domain-containing protein [Gammaproteobacteria bacterium]